MIETLLEEVDIKKGSIDTKGDTSINICFAENEKISISDSIIYSYHKDIELVKFCDTLMVNAEKAILEFELLLDVGIIDAVCDLYYQENQNNGIVSEYINGVLYLRYDVAMYVCLETKDNISAGIISRIAYCYRKDNDVKYPIINHNRERKYKSYESVEEFIQDGLEYSRSTTIENNKKSCRNQNTYIMTDNSGLFKIGKSFDAYKRLDDLSIGNPTIKLVAEIHGDHELELHEKFSSKRKKGEWLELSDDDVVYILSNYSSNITKRFKSKYKRQLLLDNI